MDWLSLTKTELSFKNLELWKKQEGKLSIAMRKAKANPIIIRHGRTRRIRSLTKGRKGSNLLSSGISRSNHPKLRRSQLEWLEKS